MNKTRFAVMVLLIAVVVLAADAGCSAVTSTVTITTTAASSSTTGTTGTTSNTYSPTTTTDEVFSITQVKYLLLGRYPDFFWCDPDSYPVAQSGAEQSKALTQFTSIQANQEEFAQILIHLNLKGTAVFSNEDKLLIYREHKKLNGAPSVSEEGSVFEYSIRTDQNQGWKITGFVSRDGRIMESNRTASYNTCPICLSRGTMIDTPSGKIAVESLRAGMTVWTLNADGEQAAVPIVKTSTTPVPDDFQMVKLTLSDGRTITASPGHPSADMKALGTYRVGDRLDGATVISAEATACSGAFTYDLLPAGDTGIYRANGIRLGSTLK
jgi:hypothetical protein